MLAICKFLCIICVIIITIIDGGVKMSSRTYVNVEAKDMLKS